MACRLFGPKPLSEPILIFWSIVIKFNVLPHNESRNYSWGDRDNICQIWYKGRSIDILANAHDINIESQNNSLSH